MGDSSIVEWRFYRNRLFLTVVDVTFGIPLVSILALYRDVSAELKSEWREFAMSVDMWCEYRDASKPALGIRVVTTPHRAGLKFRAVNSYLMEIRLVYKYEYMEVSVPREHLRSALRAAYVWLMRDRES